MNAVILARVSFFFGASDSPSGSRPEARTCCAVLRHPRASALLGASKRGDPAQDSSKTRKCLSLRRFSRWIPNPRCGLKAARALRMTMNGAIHPRPAAGSRNASRRAQRKGSRGRQGKTLALPAFPQKRGSAKLSRTHQSRSAYDAPTSAPLTCNIMRTSELPARPLHGPRFPSMILIAALKTCSASRLVVSMTTAPAAAVSGAISRALSRASRARMSSRTVS